MIPKITKILLLLFTFTASAVVTVAADHATMPSFTPKFPPSGPGTVDIVARDFIFEMPARIPSGWTTFRFFNAGMAPHFALLSLLPNGKTLEDYKSEVGAAFEGAMAAIIEDKGDKQRGFEILGKRLPPWFSQVRQMGGPGNTAPGSLSVTMARLVPGNYVVECYIKTDDGRFHTSLGMLRALTVTPEDSGATQPFVDTRIALYNGRIEVAGEFARGIQTVAVDFKEQPDAGLGNDVHLVKLEHEGELNQVIRWLDWSNLDGMTHHIPGEFLGGTQEMPVGNTAYITINLEPGNYAWVSEPGAATGMIHRFTIE